MEEAETWNSSILPANIAAHKPRDILTLILSVSYGINGENFHGAKHRQDHFTGLLWANTDCCEQMPLAVASKAEKPPSFHHVESTTCKYTSNKFELMECTPFENYLRTLYVEKKGGGEEEKRYRDTGVQ
jgi:hypothetical protein